VSFRRLAVGAALCALALSLGVGRAAADAPTELFISEYIEGSSFNKAVEVYNGTGEDVNLADEGYNLQFFFNGSGAAGRTIALTGTVGDGDVYIVAQSQAERPILDQADQTDPNTSWFNGNDAVVLRKGTDVVDVIGQIGSNPGTEWGAGPTSTADNTLRRKAGIVGGDTNGADGFDPAVEWDGFATNAFDGLGFHTTGGDAAPQVASSSPANNRVDVATDSTVAVTFSEPVSTSAGAFTLACTTSGPHEFAF
jgi:predicted extracellular nuclease